MAFFNIGKKDQDGKQVRVEHRGDYLRASRTGGVSLRAQAKAAGLTLTANSSHGVRVSTRVAKNTQVAMQNGRFVLRGRYGRGPTKLNLSKSGVTVSTRNRMGTFNWIKPKRSSAKLLGVQVRGKNAVYAHVIFMLVSLAFQIIGALLTLAWMLVRWTFWVLQQVAIVLFYGLLKTVAWISSLPEQWRNWRWARRNHRLRQEAAKPSALRVMMETWHVEQLSAATLLLFTAFGRGQPIDSALAGLLPLAREAQTSSHPLLSLPYKQEVIQILAVHAPTLDQPDMPDQVLIITAALAELVAKRTQPQALPEWLLNLDDVLVRLGPKTHLQETMLDVFCDAAELTLVPDDTLTSRSG